jgi:hypothetical protein
MEVSSMKKITVLLCLLISGFTGCKTVETVNGKYISNQGNKIEFQADSTFTFISMTDGGLKAFAKGRFKVSGGRVLLKDEYSSQLKELEATIIISETRNNYSTIKFKDGTVKNDLAFEVLLNNKKWYSLAKPLIIKERIETLQLRSFLASGLLYGTVQTVDTLKSKVIYPKSNSENFADYELSTVADAKDLYRIVVADTLKILNKNRLKKTSNNGTEIFNTEKHLPLR